MPFCTTSALTRSGASNAIEGPATGIVTVVPLLCFGAAAIRTSMVTIGLLQYIAPSLQFAEAVLLFGEPVHAVHIITFVLIWIGCALYAFDAIRAVRAPAPAPAPE